MKPRSKLKPNGLKPSEVNSLLILASRCWQDLSADDLALTVWIEPMTPLKFKTVEAAILGLAKTGAPRPTPGQIYTAALEVEAITAERKRYSLRPTEPEPTALHRENPPFLHNVLL
jgi:hypothetical protein